MLASYNGAGFLIVWLQVFGDTFRTDNREPAPFFLPCLQKSILMRTIFYVNGKRVDASTYFAADSENYRRKKLWEACISYYENHPTEFMIATMFTTEATMPMFLMDAYEKTEDYKEQVKRIDAMAQRYEDNQLITVAIAFVVIISLSLIIICCQ